MASAIPVGPGPTSSILVRLRPTGPWRIGPDSGDPDRVDRIYHSDSLYSAISGAMARLGMLEEWLEETARAQQPAVRVSSCFPFWGNTLLVVEHDLELIKAADYLVDQFKRLGLQPLFGTDFNQEFRANPDGTLTTRGKRAFPTRRANPSANTPVAAMSRRWPFGWPGTPRSRRSSMTWNG